MEENTNKAIAINSLILYARLAIVSVCGLLYTRFGLEALGVVDYGLFSVVAGVISFVAIINTIMIATSNRFMAMAIGKGDMNAANQTFNVNLTIHALIALITLIVAYPLGHWYIDNYINYQGAIDNVKMVFDMSILASVISFIGVPFNGLLLARERFFVFCSTDVLSSIAKLSVAYLLIDHFTNKLFLFALATAILTAYPTLVFILYSHRKFRDITRFRLVRDKQQYIRVLTFSANMSIGAIAFVAKAQGSALVVNMFFSTLMNSALAIANSVNSIVSIFANNIQKSISPQIVKSYAAGDLNRSIDLVCVSSKLTYMVMLMVSLPFLIVPETIFGLWLKETPEHTITFTRLLIADILVMSINAGVPDLIIATGKIKKYQLIVNGLLCCSVICGYIALRCGLPAHYLFVSYIVFSIIVFFARPILLSQLIDFNIHTLAQKVYTPAFTITILIVPLFFLTRHINGWAMLIISEIYYISLVILFGLTKKERNVMFGKIKTKLLHK